MGNRGRPSTERRPASGTGRVQLVAAAVCALLTILVAPYLGMAWEWIAPAPTYINLDGQIFLENQDSSEFIAADGWFLILGLLAGLICGALGYLRYRQNLGAVLGTALAALAGAYIAREIGIALGPPPLNQAVIGLAEGQTTTATLELKSDGVLLAWPVGVLIAHLSLIWGLERSGGTSSPHTPLNGESTPALSEGSRERDKSAVAFRRTRGLGGRVFLGGRRALSQDPSHQ